MQAGQEQAALGNIGWRHPTDQRQQGHRGMPRGQPQPQRVLLVADEPAALSGLERASAQGRMPGGVGGGTFF